MSTPVGTGRGKARGAQEAGESGPVGGERSITAPGSSPKGSLGCRWDSGWGGAGDGQLQKAPQGAGGEGGTGTTRKRQVVQYTAPFSLQRNRSGQRDVNDKFSAARKLLGALLHVTLCWSMRSTFHV